MRKTVAILMAFTLLLPLFPLEVMGASYSYEAPVEPEKWKDPDFSTDHAFSIALVGDTQYLTKGDVYQGTKKLEQTFNYIASTAKERKLAHVFVLGDITDAGYHNDANLATLFYNPPETKEWEVAKDAILPLSKAGVSYSLCRGNHDDYLICDYFGVPEYTDQFQSSGGFFSDSEAKYKSHRESHNPDGYVYWSALSGKIPEEKIIVNSYKTMELFGQKYIFITLDYNPTTETLKLLDALLTKYSDHKAIIATHSFTKGNGTVNTTEKGDTKFPFGNSADKIWDQYLSHHENVILIASGHKAALKPVWRYTLEGTNGNFVRQVLVDPQGYDVKENADGTISSGKQDTGMVLYLNFSADGMTVTFDHYSTLLNREYAGLDETMYINQKDLVANPKKLAQTTSVTTTTTKRTTTTPTSTPEITLSDMPSGVFLPSVLIGTAAFLIGGAAIIFVRGKKRKK